MTELTEPEHAAAQPSPEWPGTTDAAITDPVVAQVLARLGDLPHVPATEHETIYNGIHDDLLAVLNSEPVNSEPVNSEPVNSEPGRSGPTDGAA